MLLSVTTFVPEEPIVVDIDHAFERCWGAKISIRGIYRDPVRSSHGHFMEANGLRCLCVMLPAPVPWASYV